MDHLSKSANPRLRAHAKAANELKQRITRQVASLVSTHQPGSIMKHYDLYLAGKKHAGADKLDVTNKFTGEVIATVARADADMLEQAIAAGKACENTVASLMAHEKQAILEYCVSAFEDRFDELTQALIDEGGKPRGSAVAEVKRLISTFKLARDTVTTMPLGEVIPLDVTKTAEGYRGMTQRVPIGLCSLISPFNFPLNLTAHKIAPAIVAGCPFVLKPASSTPISALIIAEVLASSGLPEGAFSILPMSSDIADKLVTDERIKLLSFTGSDQIGWDMKARAGKKKVVLELGGNAAVMVEPGTDLDMAVPRIITGGYSQNGQVCISVQRVLAHAEIYDEVKTKLTDAVKAIHTGDPDDEDTLVGPMISTKERDRAHEWITQSIKDGATALVEGGVEGQVLKPYLLEGVAHSDDIYEEEAFCPVVILERYESFSEGIKLVNQSRYGLQIGVYTPSIDDAFTAWDQIAAGGVVINDVPTFRVDNMPYGGVKDSGLGREGIRYAVLDMSEERLLVIKHTRKAQP